MLTAMAAIAGVSSGPFVDADVSQPSFIIRSAAPTPGDTGEIVELHNPPGSCDPDVRDDRRTRRKTARRLRATRGRR